MNRKNRKKRMRLHPEKGLVLGLIVSLAMSLFSFGAVFAEEKTGAAPFEAGEATDAALNTADPVFADPSENPEEDEKEPAKKEINDPAALPAQTDRISENEASPSQIDIKSEKEDSPAAEQEEEIITATAPTESVSSEAKMQGGAIIASGPCGPSAEWALNDEGTLTISGTGELNVYTGYKTTPWFPYYDSIKSLIVNKGITNIPNFAFQNCKGLATVSLPAGLQIIGAAAFKGTAVSEVIFPNSLTEIGDYAFNQSQLESVDLQSTNAYAIGTGAFMNCDKLKTVALNDVIVTLFHTFDWDENLETVEFGGGEVILDGTFRGCTSLKNVNLPATIQYIGWATFGGCESLTSLKLPAALTQIADNAFAESGLTSVTLPSKLETIGKAAFYRTKLTAVTIPKSVKSIGRAAFPSGTKVTKLAAMTAMQDGSQKRTDLVVVIKPKIAVSQKTARKMFGLINSFRTGPEAWYYNESNQKVKASGLKNLSYDYTLEKIAQQRAAEIALNFSHMRPDGSTCFELAIKDSAGNYVSTVAENIISGYSTYEKAMDALKETGYLYDGQGHRRNMLSADYKAVGIAHVAYEGKHYWVQEFGTEKSKTAKTAAQNGTVSMSVQTWTESNQVNALTVSGKPLKLGIGMKAVAPKAGVTVRFAHGKYAGVTASKAVDWVKSSNPAVVKLADGKVAGKKAGATVFAGVVCAQKVKAKVTVLATPKLPVLKKSRAGVIIKWAKVSGASGYAVFRKAGNGKWKRIAVTAKRAWLDKKVKRGVKYTYTIRCISKNKKAYESNYNKKGKKIKFS